jgi:organic hydroperoxide reductase OsmC/OhrA
VMPEDGKPVRITRIVLRPRITVRAPATHRQLLRLVDLAHRECFIANSLLSEISLEPAITILAE